MQSTQQDLGKVKDTSLGERGTRHQVAKEKRPQGLQQLMGHHAPISTRYPLTDLAQFHGTEFVFFGSFTVSTIFFLQISHVFGPSTTEET
jgi:hypothetical protein